MSAVLKLDEIYTLSARESVARWDELQPLIERIPETVTTPHSHIRDMVEKAEAQVWCIGTPVECLLVTKVENSMDERYGLMWVASGDGRVMSDLKPIVENWFREIGCKKATLIGRRGWKKRLPDYTEQAIHMVKTL